MDKSEAGQIYFRLEGIPVMDLCGPVSSGNTDLAMTSKEYTRFIREAALRHGFMGCGISRAGFMEEEARHLEEWLNRGYHGEMAYMANHFDLRVDPTRLVPGAKSVVSLMFNYDPGLPLNPLKGTDPFVESSNITSSPITPSQITPSQITPLQITPSQITPSQITPSQITDHVEAEDKAEGDHTLPPKHHTRSPTTDHSITDKGQAESWRIARYALGEDYHKVLRRKLKALVGDLKREIGDVHARVFVDSAPVLERDWARRSGVGWVGKNTLLLHPKKGSYFFLAEIILDVELEYDHPMRDHCGTCTRCIDACPTEAISPQGYLLDGSKCISYLTIELKSAIPDEFKGKMEGWVFGCDICQEVCPWNRFSVPHEELSFTPVMDGQGLTERDWIEMTEEVFGDRFGKTPLKRAGLEKLKETVRFVGMGD